MWFEHRTGRVNKEKYLSHLNKQNTLDKVSERKKGKKKVIKDSKLQS